MAKVILFTLLASQSVFAAQGWFTRTCEYLLGGAAAKAPPASMSKVAVSMEEDIFYAKKFNEHSLNAVTVPLSFLNEEPFGLEILPQLNSSYIFVRKPDLRLFSNPQANDWNWNGDNETGLNRGPSLILLFENEPVTVNGKQSDVAALLREKFASILARNPQMTGELKIGTPADIPGLEFRREYRGHKVAWLEGPLLNSHIKRSMLLLLTHAFSQMTSDPAFAVKAPQPPPTRH